MPKTPIDYSKTIIYKICCKDPTITDVYVGHTTDLTKRRCRHKYCCNNPENKYFNCLKYQFIRENGGWSNWEIVVIEEFNCKNHEEALQKERYFIETMKASLNKVIPSRSEKEYREDNKEILKEYHEKWRKENTQKLHEYRELNKEKIKENQEKWRQENRTQINKKSKEWRESNQSKVEEYYKHKKKIITCECGCNITQCNIKRHEQSRKHFKFLQKVNSNQ